ncbi:calcium-binding protein [Actinoplanes sp. NPDC049681]|uniref:calcium-binding protein n=1 Tax=Actinoplanes sp. NPDC049681 TaxID=3363905 RepID=UPI00378910CF
MAFVLYDAGRPDYRCSCHGGRPIMSHRSWSAGVGTALTVTLTAVGLGAPAQAAATGTAKVVGTTKVTFTAASGKANSVTVTRSGRVITIDDKVAVKPGHGCRKDGHDATKVACTTPSTPTLVTIDAGDKNDVITNKTNLEMIGLGGSGNDTITGGSVRDSRLDGGAGNDKVYGGGGNDDLYGGSGNDRLNGGADADELDGGTGADLLQGGAGSDHAIYWTRTRGVNADLDGKADDGERGEKDTIATDVENLWGGFGNDTLTGNEQSNYIDGGGGKDLIRGGAGNDLIGAEGSLGNTIYGQAGDDYINAGDGNDMVWGGAGADFIYGESGNDKVYGEAGKDVVEGDEGNDDLRGGPDDDWLTGGAGNDKLFGEAGDDQIRGTGDIVSGESDTELDAADGGPDGTEAGDTCSVGAAGTKVNCE